MRAIARASSIYENIGRSLRSHRLAAGLTLDELAESSGMSPAYIGQIERNRKKPSLLTVAVLSQALGLPVDRLLDHSKEPPRLAVSQRIEILIRRLNPREQEVLVSIVRNLVKGLRATR
jgi:transcriptional regulator with XRE-family HTH domain